jgi:hypothetical protein
MRVCVSGWVAVCSKVTPRIFLPPSVSGFFIALWKYSFCG